MWYRAAALIITIIGLMLVIEYAMQTNGNKRNAENTSQVLLDQVTSILSKNDEAEKELLESLKEDYIVRAKAVAYIIDHNESAEYDVDELSKIAKLMLIDEIHLFDETGTIYSGSVPKYYGLNFNEGEQIRYFIPMLDDKSLSMCQDVTPNTAEGKNMMYAIAWNEDGTKMIQVGIEPLRLLTQLRQNAISKVISDMPMYKGIEIYVADIHSKEIFGATVTSKIGKTLDEIGIYENLINQGNTTQYINGKKYYCNFCESNELIIGVTFSVSESNNNLILSLFLVFIYLSLAAAVIISIMRRLFKSNAQRDEQLSILTSMSDIYYSMHLVDLDDNIVKEYTAHNQVKDVVSQHKGKDAVKIFQEVMQATMSDEYLETGLKFTDLTTLPERMKNKKLISAELLGRNVGWIRMSFITIDADSKGLPKTLICTTQVIEEEKRREETLIQQSNTDELTKCFNRRAYENDLLSDTDIPSQNNFVYVSMDVNGLKTVNDTLGHAAGDELLRGSAECMQQCMGSYGRIYRTGGDEFVAMIFANEDRLKKIRTDFDNVTLNWSGKLVEQLSISCGYVSKKEFPDLPVTEMAKIADKRMYEAKSNFYRTIGVDRRGQMAALTKLYSLNIKILKINVTDDTYQVIKIKSDEEPQTKAPSAKISEILYELGTSGYVHNDDLEEYLSKTSLEYLRDYFKSGKTSFSIFYRRRLNNEYKPVILEMIPAEDYSDENQNLFLYVRELNK